MKNKIILQTCMLFLIMCSLNAFAASVPNITTYLNASGTNFTVYLYNQIGDANWTAPIGITSVDVLVVAGGGSGGRSASYAGGGGAGGLLYNNSFPVVSNSNYGISVGAGGAGVSSLSASGNSGSNSTFSTLIAIGGGGGGRASVVGNGGSGGGGGDTATHGLGTAGQGNNGGYAYINAGGGGGGAGTNGTNATVTGVGGPGGNGTAYSINGSSVYYAGGGGGMGNVAGSIGGLGGGGNGVLGGAGGDGTNGLGGGGGASTTTSGAGGSGIVIIRYLTDDVDNPPSVNLSSPPADYTNSTSQYVNLTFNATVTDYYNLVNCSLWHNATGVWHQNQTQTVTGTSNTTSFTLNNLNNVSFVWNIRCFDNASQSSFAASNRSAVLDWYPTFYTYLNGSGTNFTVYVYDRVGTANWTAPVGVTSVDVLVVAGGGAGGKASASSGGGGAGGLIYNSSYSVSSGSNYSLNVGGGGAGRTTSGTGASGENSTFDTLTAVGGGGGGGSTSAGGSGGSGGGAQISYGTGILGQGNNGGGGTGVYVGGGGGAGSVGVTANATIGAGDGGTGLAYDISGSSLFYAGGGGGFYRSGTSGTGGSGVGGDGGSTPGNGTNGRGGGGGGGGSSISGAGGSGIVIIRYRTIEDYSTPIFSDYWDNNGTISNSGIGHFNVTVNNTNGTVLFEINGQNISATNLTYNVYNVSYYFASNGTYSYMWWAYGNGTISKLNVSETRSYTVNYTCIPNLVNTSQTTYNVTVCQTNDTIDQVINWTQYDSNYCEVIENITFTNNNYIICNYCGYNVINSSWSSWSNVSCVGNNMNQSKFFTEYDANYETCYVITGLPSDLWNSGNNNTYYNYTLVGPSYANTSWSSWNNISCLYSDTMNQTRNLTQYDIYYCAANSTFIEYQNIAFCDYCTPSPANTSWSQWTNVSCVGNNMNQSQYQIEYDANYETCYAITGLPSDQWNSGNNNTYYNYTLVGPNYKNTSFGLWNNIGCIGLTGYHNESRNLTQYDEYYCATNTTIIEYQSIANSSCLLTLTCNGGGPYSLGTDALFSGTLTDGRAPINSHEINLSLYKDSVIENYSAVNTIIDGTYQKIYSGLEAGTYLVNASTSYLGYNATCTDTIIFGGPASLMLDKILSVHNMTNETISYNVTLRIVNYGESKANNLNITDEDSIDSPYLLGELLQHETIQISYIKEFSRGNTTEIMRMSVAHAAAIDNYSKDQINADSTATNISIPGIGIGKYMVITKNIIFVSENTTAIIYNVSSTLFNAGDENLNGLGYMDSDINTTATIISLEIGKSIVLSNLVTIEKAASNINYNFAIGTATIGSLYFYSNRPSVRIPGYGGPADTYVYAPASVAASTSFDTIIEIKNLNQDIGQNFIIDYWITNEAENANYSSGQSTTYAPALGSINITVTMMSPATAGNYKLKAVNNYIGGPDTAYDSFIVTEQTNPRPGGGGGGGGSTKCKTEWQCTEWSECNAGIKTRECKKAKLTCDAGEMPEVAKQCYEEIIEKKRDNIIEENKDTQDQKESSKNNNNEAIEKEAKETELEKPSKIIEEANSNIIVKSIISTVIVIFLLILATYNIIHIRNIKHERKVDDIYPHILYSYIKGSKLENIASELINSGHEKVDVLKHAEDFKKHVDMLDEFINNAIINRWADEKIIQELKKIGWPMALVEHELHKARQNKR